MLNGFVVWDNKRVCDIVVFGYDDFFWVEIEYMVKIIRLWEK